MPFADCAFADQPSSFRFRGRSSSPFYSHPVFSSLRYSEKKVLERNPFTPRPKGRSHLRPVLPGGVECWRATRVFAASSHHSFPSHNPSASLSNLSAGDLLRSPRWRGFECFMPSVTLPHISFRSSSSPSRAEGDLLQRLKLFPSRFRSFFVPFRRRLARAPERLSTHNPVPLLIIVISFHHHPVHSISQVTCCSGRSPP